MNENELNQQGEDPELPASKVLPISAGYLLFSQREFHPIGGMWDYQGKSCDIPSAKKEAKRLEEESGHDWWQIVDAETMKVVEAEGHSCYGDPEDLI